MGRIALALVVVLKGAAASASASPYAATVFAGNLLNNTWEETFLDPAGLQFETSGLAGFALSADVAEPVRGLTLGVEGQLVRHFGSQSHWELNAPIGVARWSRFPWSDTVATSAAFGLGLSFASETPRLEETNEGESAATLAYWMMELELGAPASDWSVVGRLHHRSTAYGLFGDDGGANALALGVRRRF